jgi:hypothetical protein
MYSMLSMPRLKMIKVKRDAPIMKGAATSASITFSANIKGDFVRTFCCLLVKNCVGCLNYTVNLIIDWEEVDVDVMDRVVDSAACLVLSRPAEEGKEERK